MYYFRRFTDVFPRNIITGINKKFLALYLRDFLFLVQILIAGMLLQLLVSLHQKIDASERIYEEQMSEYAYWRGVAMQYPNIPDIQYNAAVGALKVGSVNEAIYHIDQSLILDPLFSQAKELKMEIENLKN